jgi:hypothetical protein
MCLRRVRSYDAGHPHFRGDASIDRMICTAIEGVYTSMPIRTSSIVPILLRRGWRACARCRGAYERIKLLESASREVQV